MIYLIKKNCKICLLCYNISELYMELQIAVVIFLRGIDMTDIFKELKERNVVKQTVYEEELGNLLKTEKVSFYVGFDPTADSLHIGHFATLVMASRLQKAGHKPYILIGGATAMIGDPTGRSDMRPMMTKDTIQHNVDCIKKQLEKILDFEGENGAVVINNADWLLNLNYIDFIREIGANMSVNKMLSYDCFKKRYEKGLTFLEFNYMPMQTYDFYYLYNKYNVQLEVGGDDQWANMLSGADFIRRKLGKPAYALTFPLLARSDGQKMGKSVSGAIWLDASKTSPVEMYQFFRNTSDDMVEQQLRLLTFVPVEEIVELTKYKDERINKAKEILAYEIVKLVHGKEVADNVLQQVKADFSGDEKNMSTQEILSTQFNTILDIVVKFGGVKSNGEARRLIDGRAIKINDRVVTDYYDEIPEKSNGEFILHKGKKLHLKIVVNE